MTTYTVRFKIRGDAYLTVEADSEEEALEAGWAKYHAGEELEDLTWGVEDADAEES